MGIHYKLRQDALTVFRNSVRRAGRHGKYVSGLHVPWNLKVIRAEINLAKSTLIVDEWLPRVEELPIDPDRLPWGGLV